MRWTLGFLNLMVFGVAAAQPMQDFSEQQPLSDLPQYAKTLVDEPNYAIIERGSPGDLSRLKRVEVDCPSGLRAMGAGYLAASGAGEPPDWRVILSTPNDTGTGWLAFAMFDGKGNRGNLPAPFEWVFKVRLVCAKLP